MGRLRICDIRRRQSSSPRRRSPAPRAELQGRPTMSGGVVPPIGVQPAARQGNLTYHGGPVMHTNKTYAIYWVPAGYSVTASYKAMINQYFTDVAAASGATSNVYSVETQYYDTAPNPSPGNVQVQLDLRRLRHRHERLPHKQRLPGL